MAQPGSCVEAGIRFFFGKLWMAVNILYKMHKTKKYVEKSR